MPPPAVFKRMALAPSARELIWRRWGDIYVVFQRASAETHVFNETTAMILRTLEQGAASWEEVLELTREALGVTDTEFVAGDFAGTASRLEELGLIEWQNEVAAEP